MATAHPTPYLPLQAVRMDKLATWAFADFVMSYPGAARTNAWLNLNWLPPRVGRSTMRAQCSRCLSFFR